MIPLAKKLENCGVFGVSSDECLNYALANREEWEAKGKDIVANMVEKYSNAGSNTGKGTILEEIVEEGFNAVDC